jgi:hypothetical protein
LLPPVVADAGAATVPFGLVGPQPTFRERPTMLAAPSPTHRRTDNSPLHDVGHIEVVLLPGGHVALSGTEPVPEAGWEVLGHAWEAGTPMAFLRIELGGASWATLLPKERLARSETGLRVMVRRQSSIQQDPLVGWTLFC